jgi:hypothetical protein
MNYQFEQLHFHHLLCCQGNLTFIPALSPHPGFSDFSLSTQGKVPDD